MPIQHPHLASRFRASLPTREGLATHPWLKPFAGSLGERRLWQLQHETVARGAAVGVFWAFAAPVAQILVAAVHCAWWRANIPVAAAVTLLTNPFTIGFWLWLAYQTGSWLLGTAPVPPEASGMDALTLLAQYGVPAAVGMGLFAVCGAATAYVGVKLAWRLHTTLKWRKRRQREWSSAAR